MLGSVQRDQRSPTQALEPRQWSGCPDRLEEQRVERGWRGTIQQLTDIVVAEDRRYAEQRLAVRAAMTLLRRPLVCQERGTSHEEYRESRQADVRHRVVAIAARPFALVRQTGADSIQLRDQFVNEAHPAVELKIESGHKGERLQDGGKGTELRTGSNSTTCGILDSVQRATV